MTLTLNEKFLTLQEEVGTELLEREDIIETGILALISAKHHFQLGTPGVAKSALIERIVARIGGFPEGGYFHYLLDKFTKPEELFGPPDMQELMDNKRLVRVTDYALPSAYVAFLDEIFKGNSSVLNALLLAMNEREYNTDRGPQPIPLISIFSASNELPESRELGAMWDRLHIRHWVENLQSGDTFTQMLTADWEDDPEKIITLEDIEAARIESKKVVLGDNILGELYDLRLLMRSEGLEPSDRRWRHAVDVIKAAAWMDGATSAEDRHARILQHMLWDNDETRRKVQNMCLDLADPLERRVQALYDELGNYQKQWRDAVAREESEQKRQGLSSELWKKAEKHKRAAKGLQREASDEGRTLPSAAALIGNVDGFIKELLQEGFSLDVEELLAGRGTKGGNE